MKVRVVGTRKQPGRCAFCHDRLEALGHRCEGCQTWLHLDCWREVKSCPSPGCEEKPPVVAPAGRRGHAEDGAARASQHRDRGRGRAHARDGASLEAWAAESARTRKGATWQARWGPYARLLLSLLFSLALLLLVLALVGRALSDPAEFWQGMRRGKGGRSSDATGFVSLVMAGGFSLFCGYFSLSWLWKWPAVWGETQRLLNFATPEALRMRIWKERIGKHTKIFAEFKHLDGTLRVGMGKVSIGGILPPFWLRNECLRKPVLVYGLEDGEPPYLIEDISGQLALIHP